MCAVVILVESGIGEWAANLASEQALSRKLRFLLFIIGLV